MPNIRLAAVLIVRDEAAVLARALSSLHGVVDEIAVYDTGSADPSVQIARAAGAVVTRGHWDGDFSRARNAALQLTGADWVLSLDADEEVRADVGALHALLDAWGRRDLDRDAVDVGAVLIESPSPPSVGGSVRHHGPRLLRRGRVAWVGRVHERPVRLDGGSDLGVARCPGDVLTLLHHGYGDVDLVHAKAERNAALGRVEVDALLREGRSERLPQALLDLGRSLVGCGRGQEAAAAFGSVRALAPGSRQAMESTDALAGVMAASGDDRAVLELVGELRAGGVDRSYCDWLAGQALAQLGRPLEALELLRGVDSLVDAGGRRHEVGQVVEARALAALLAGERAEALDCLAEAMAGHGRIRGRGELFAQLAADTPAAQAARALARHGRAHLPAVAAELTGCRDPGPVIAGMLGLGAAFTPAGRVPISPACLP